MATRVPKQAVKIAAARAMKSGDLHNAGAVGRSGYYADTLAVAIGDKVVLHTAEWVQIVAPSSLVLAVGTNVLFDYATQAAVATGGEIIGEAVYAKTSGQTLVTVALNNSGTIAA